MCHYHSSEASNKPIGHDHFYLNDSGGQYVNGTTDATRTLAWGKVDPQQRLHYTAVLRGFLSLITLQFPLALRGISWMPSRVVRCGRWGWITITAQGMAWGISF
jgi:Xaa-Pro aminopeptidase